MPSWRDVVARWSETQTQIIMDVQWGMKFEREWLNGSWKRLNGWVINQSKAKQFQLSAEPVTGKLYHTNGAISCAGLS